MPNVTIKRYEDTKHGFLGTIEADDGSWIVFVDLQGKPQLWINTPTGYALA